MTCITDTQPESRVAEALVRADQWLDSMRDPQGYGGPVSHWWQSCLLYTGAGLDWRYEGIIAGYLQLSERTGDRRWLAKARRAGDDLAAGQLPDGRFRSSSFELNPLPGGTPHEAACDIALLMLARGLRAAGQSGWERYAEVAERNLRGYWIARLWDPGAGAFRDDQARPSFVPNKAATLAEALFLLAGLRGDDELITRYALPTLDAILRHQIAAGPLGGAICQNSFGRERVEKFLPYYIARCVPGLLLGYEHTRSERYLAGALLAIGFVLRWQYEDGSLPQAVYPGGRVNRYPQWVAAIGDVVRVVEVARPYGIEHDTGAMWGWLLRGQQRSGGFATAHGFASQISQRRPRGPADVRDLLPVCGWSDKAFRALAGRAPAALSGAARFGSHTVPAQLRGRQGIWIETQGGFTFTAGPTTLYRWRKGRPWAEIAGGEALWK